MSDPFIIWTMQRTGGTLLAQLLMDMSEHRPAQHEPFNWQRDRREFAHIAQEWTQTADEPALFGALGDVFAQNYLIKHCYELHPMSFNLRLIAAASTTKYRHVHLLRQDECLRLISKFVAEANGTWFKDYADRVFAEVRNGKRALPGLSAAQVVEHYRRCRDAIQRITKGLHTARVEFHEVYYEDLFTGPSARRQETLDRLLAFLGVNANAIAEHRSRVNDKIANNSQTIRSILGFVPNLAEVTQALEAAGCPCSTPRGKAEMGEHDRRTG